MLYIIFLYEKLKKYSIQSFKECLCFVFCLFCFLLLSNNTLHVMFYTYICYWNTFQYKYITFHAVKQSHERMTSKDICLLFIILFLCLFPLLSSCTVISESSKKAKTKATKKKGQKTFCFWCCVKEGTINFVLLFCWKKQKKQQKNNSRFVDSLLFLSTLRGWIFPWALSRKLIT